MQLRDPAFLLFGQTAIGEFLHVVAFGEKGRAELLERWRPWRARRSRRRQSASEYIGLFMGSARGIPRKDGERLFDKVAFQRGTFRGMLPLYSADETLAKVNLESLQLSRAV